MYKLSHVELQLVLTVYSTTLFLAAFVIRPVMMRLKHGIWGIKYKQTNPFMKLSAVGFKLMLVLIIASIFCLNIGEAAYPYTMPAPWLEVAVAQYLGLLFLCAGFFLIVVAQYQMRASWRIGLDDKVKTELVRKGLYRYSRNPIYFGIFCVLIGYFCSMPSGLTLTALVLGFFVLQITVIAEEEYLRQSQGEDYVKFVAQVRRWL
jgi:protein-S-isoprenylcysteine O-methyltransferase Ste14